MKNSEYWVKRFEILEEAAVSKGSSYFETLEAQYREASRTIESEISTWYQRFAVNNNISLSEARRLLNSSELKEFKWTVQDFIKYGEENALNQQWMKQLENASAKVHISRLEALKIQTQQQMEVLYGNQIDGIDTLARKIYADSYYHTAYEIQKGFNVGWDLQSLNDKQLERVLSKPWTADNQTFRDKCWTQKASLVSTVQTELTQSIMRGDSPDKAIKTISEKFNVAKSKAGRLVMTESAYFSSEAQKNCFNELDVERYEIVATLDSHTSELCQSLDGQVFDMKDYQPGVTAPPFHPWCRTTTVPYFEDNYGERAARGEDGKTYYVPSDMKYSEWKKSMVDGDTSDLKEVVPDDIMKVQDKISETNNKIDDLKQQFNDTTEGYSYDEWFSEFDSIEDGFGDVTEDDISQVTKLKDLDSQIKELNKTKTDLLLQKDRRKQIDTGFTGRIPDDELDSYNKKALEQIKVDTGYSDNDAEKFHTALKEYFGGDYEKILTGDTNTARILRDGLDRMPIYDGSVYRGLCFSEYSDGNITQFTSLKIGDKLPSKGIISSWSSDKRVAESFGAISTQSADSSTVILECIDNNTGVGVQHLSKFGSREAEVLSSANYEVLEIVTESKYDYVSRRKDLLYFSDDLTTLEDELKKQVVCVIKVKEV